MDEKRQPPHAVSAAPNLVLVGYVHPDEVAAALFESGEGGFGYLPISPEPWGVMTMPLYRLLDTTSEG